MDYAGLDQFRDVVARLGDVRPQGRFLRFRCLFPERHAHGDRTPSAWAAVNHSGNLNVGCMGCRATFEEFVAAVGLPASAWFADKSRKPWSRPVDKVVATYEYRDRDGTLLFQKRRHEPKRFDQRRPLPPEFRRRLGVPASAESWVWGLAAGWYGRHKADGWHFRPISNPDNEQVQLPECPRVLYRLPELLKADPRQPVLVTEGEKSADALAALGYVATCGSFGSSAWPASYSAELAGRRVVLFPDHDGPGYELMDCAAGSLIRAGVAELRYAEWPADSHAGYDPADFLADLGEADPKAAVVEMAKRATVYKRG